jgi:hypothetical protein
MSNNPEIAELQRVLDRQLALIERLTDTLGHAVAQQAELVRRLTALEQRTVHTLKA